VLVEHLVALFTGKPMNSTGLEEMKRLLKTREPVPRHERIISDELELVVYMYVPSHVRSSDDVH
jgi:hypothetical protein